MSSPLFSERQRSAIQELMRLSAGRARAEAEVEAGFRSRNAAADAELQTTQDAIQAQLDATQSAAIQEFQERTAAVNATFEEEHGDVSREFAGLRLKVNTLFEADSEKAAADDKEARWSVATVFEADMKVAKDQMAKRQKLVGTWVQKAEAQYLDAATLIKSWQLHKACAALNVTAPPLPEAEDSFGALKRSAATVEAALDRLSQMLIPRLLKGNRFYFLVAAIWVVLLAPAPLMAEWYYWVAATTAAVASISLVVRLWLALTCRAQVLAIYRPLRQSSLAAELLHKRCLDQTHTDYHQQTEAARRRQEGAAQTAAKENQRRGRELMDRRAAELRQGEEKYQPVLEGLVQQRDADLSEAEETYQRIMSESSTRYEADMQASSERHARLKAESKKTYVTQWQTLASRWKQGLGKFSAVIQEVGQECQRLFPDWSSPAWNSWTLPAAVPPGVRFGTLQVGLDRIPNGVPRDERLRALGTPTFKAPALLPFPERGSLVLKAGEEGRAEAVRVLQAVMLRCLTGVPAGKVRFTIVDPVGLGENFAAFTHLADYDEALVCSRIWTEPQHIEQRLADLTEHIENVIQKYLRNQFQTLEEYNAQAGEVAEPYRFLVVANFPANFTVEAARRLASIAASGARCGIRVLLSVDGRQELPQDFNLTDLEQTATVLEWREGRFHWRDEVFDLFPLTLEEPPGHEQCTALLMLAGERAREAGRVEVPFDSVAPPPQEWWTGDSRKGLRVPLGKAGATRKQYLELGKGTSQHVLIAGKTGSGKSTLLHALITQLALLYRPDEVELYLIDFKKGVEFKTYAVHELPHARVVAVESEREFGLSVLQRLDAELKERGDRFRQLGVHDLASYRQAQKGPMPRVLMIVDEFQEFFVEDDKVAQEAALLLDRLVRQGRAFGIHILLGSQTLGGAYSLARSTIDQMAVRIALQCSEADGHLILSKENSAARLLSRPGEAIYNDANGLVEANDVFQTVWLSDEKRDECMDRVRELALTHHYVGAPQIVFEGNVPASIARNPLLQRLLEAPERPTVTTWPAWLGEAIAIKDPTAAVFRRQSGANLLMVGQHGEAALGILTAAVLSLGAQVPTGPGGSCTYWLGEPGQDAPGADGLLTRLGEVLPQAPQMVGWREIPEVFASLSAEVDRRHKERQAVGPPLFLFIYGLQRFRDLRKQEDDFGLSRRGEAQPVQPAKLLANLVREGPAVGVFTLLWCDTLNNLNRAFDRQALREFEMRVLFQMSGNDSSNLIDSPLAAKLGLYRALFYTEEQGRVEKFRPYGYPAEEWLAWVKDQLAAV